MTNTLPIRFSLSFATLCCAVVAGCDQPALPAAAIAVPKVESADGLPALVVLLDLSRSGARPVRERCAEAAARVAQVLAGQASRGLDVAVLGTTSTRGVQNLVPWQVIAPPQANPFGVQAEADWRKAGAQSVLQACSALVAETAASPLHTALHAAARTLTGHCSTRASAGRPCGVAMLAVHSDGEESVDTVLRQALRTPAAQPIVPTIAAADIADIRWCGLDEVRGVAPAIMPAKGGKRKAAAKAVALPADHKEVVWQAVLGRPFVVEGVCPFEAETSPALAGIRAAGVP
jgi:hypothetical protein